MTKNALLIFIRNPELGKVKTRLAKDLGAEEALRIYQKLLDHTRNIVLKTAAACYLYYSDFIDKEDAWSNVDFKKFLQPQGDLGDRMLKAFDHALTENDAAIIIGSDCPGLTETILQTAFNQLKNNDFVIGPAMDGGYYLLGMKKLAPRLLLDMTRSTDKVFEETVRRMEQMGASYYVLPVLSDIDYAEDWEKYGHLIP